MVSANGLHHQLQWVTALPLWETASAEPARMQAPGLLRFDTDRFMEELIERLQAQPKPDLSGQLARWESFRERAPGEPAEDPPGTPLKLYQPAHGRFYLVAASLVCRLPGLPDHTVDTARGERASFVLRRRRPEGGEEAWVRDPEDPQKKRRLWKPLTAGQLGALAPTEELLPLFPVNFTVEGRRRRLLVGLVPTSSHDTFESAGSFAPPDAEGSAVEAEARDRVIEPYRELVTQEPPPEDTPPEELQEQRRLEQETSRFLLLDLAELLRARLPEVWSALNGQSPPPTAPVSRALFDRLSTASADQGSVETWRTALVKAWAERILIGTGQPSTLTINLRYSTLPPETLEATLAPAARSSPHVPSRAPERVPKLEGAGQTEYVLRCIYQRPHCAWLPPLVSTPTVPFRLSPFFDADAPSRPIRIELPADTSIAGLRKFKKSVGFNFSPRLRSQMSKVSDLKSLVLFGRAKGGKSFSLGELCMFSIPIITLCALAVLMIFLKLLNIVFWWRPFIKVCLPRVR